MQIRVCCKKCKILNQIFFKLTLIPFFAQFYRFYVVRLSIAHVPCVVFSNNKVKMPYEESAITLQKSMAINKMERPVADQDIETLYLIS